MEYFNQLTIHSISLQMWLKGTIIQLNYFFIVFRGYYLKVWNVLTVNSIWPCPAEKAIIRQRVKLGPQWDTVCLSLIKGSQSFGAAIPFLLSYVTPCMSEVKKQEARKPIWSRIWSLPPICFCFILWDKVPWTPGWPLLLLRTVSNSWSSVSSSQTLGFQVLVCTMPCFSPYLDIWRLLEGVHGVKTNTWRYLTSLNNHHLTSGRWARDWATETKSRLHPLRAS